MQEQEVARPPPGASLTNREQEVLDLLAFGLSNKEIAQRLLLSPRTVETHIDRILGKLSAPTRTRAVVEASRAGLLRGPSAGAELSGGRPNNLPFQLSALLGREQDIADLRSLLTHNRLITLCGAGGIGKTRLALRTGVDLLGSCTGGVWFCDFSTISDPALVTSVVAKAVRVRESGERSPTATIVHALKRKHALLIFDNCEHVIESSAELADEILHECANVRILTTSRQPLGIIGEVVHRLRSLSVPDPGVQLSASESARFGAVALFLDRARGVDPHFRCTEQNAQTIATICRRLDGIPLAIELAAARVNVLSPETIARSLDDRFTLLTSGSRTALPRHKTLAALVDWSYDRLSDGERRLFTRLGIFVGDFSLSAAGEVCGAGARDVEVLDTITALVDKSLVVAQTENAQERYRLIETTRAYALEKLKANGEHTAMARRHAEYFRGRALAADRTYGMVPASHWLAAEEVDLENYRAALEWALTQHRDPALGGAIAGSLERLWALTGLSNEGRTWIDTALEQTGDERYAAITARLYLAKARFLQGQTMRDCTQHAFELYNALGDRRGAGYALRSLAYSLLQMGQLDEAADAIARSISALRECGDAPGVASCYGLQGVNAYNGQAYAAGRRFYLQAIDAYAALGDDLSMANVLGNLAELEFADGRPQEALRSVSESLAITSRGKEATEQAIDRNNSAAYRIALNDLEGAGEDAREALLLARSEQNAWNVAVALQHFALLAAARGQTDRGAHLIGYVNAQYHDLGLEREATERWGYEKLMRVLRKDRAEDDIETLAAAGAAWSEEEAVREALAVSAACTTT